MALEFQSVSQQESEVKEEPKLETGITVVEADDTYGKFAIEPLEQGYGMTLGNPLRRVTGPYGLESEQVSAWLRSRKRGPKK